MAWSRHRPHPWDAEVDLQDGAGWVGVMLKPGDAGLLVGKKSDSLANVSPQSWSYADQDPSRETTTTFSRLIGGMGARQPDEDAQRPRYYYADGVDTSIAGRPMLGPLFVTEALPGLPAGTQTVHQFIVALDQVVGLAPLLTATPTLICLVGRYAYRRRAGVWSLGHDFGVGNEPLAAVNFAGLTGTGGLFVSTQLNELWKMDANGGWTQAVLPASAQCQYVAAVGHELWIGGNGVVRKASNDPMLAASWGGEIALGDQFGPGVGSITGLVAVGDQMLVPKTNGLYGTTTTGTGVLDVDLFPELKNDPRTTNGRNAAVWRDAVWLAYGDAFYRVTAGATAELDPVGPERLLELGGSPISGAPIAAAGWADWHLFLATYNATTGASHLLKYGTWVNDARAGYDLTDVWHGAIASWAGKEVTRIDVVHTTGTPVAGGEPSPALWVGFSDGTVQYARLPSASPDPTSDPLCRYVATGRLYWPSQVGGYPVTTKSWHALSLLPSVFPTGTWARQAYRLSQAGAYTTIGTDWTPALAAAGLRVALPDDATSLVLDAYTDLFTTDPTATPVLEGVALHWAVRPTLRLEWQCTVKAANRLVRRDGVVSRRSASAIRALVKAAAANPGMVRIRLSDETLSSIALIQYTEVLAPAERRWGLAWDVPIVAVAYR